MNFMASVRQMLRPDGSGQIRWKHICSGFLISEEIILTTSFCVNIIRRLGAENFSSVTILLGINQEILDSKVVYRIKKTETYDEYNLKYPTTKKVLNLGLVLVCVSNNLNFFIRSTR